MHWKVKMADIILTVVTITIITIALFWNEDKIASWQENIPKK